MTETERDYYGNDARAINKHSTRTYDTAKGPVVLDRTCDAVPRYFQALGFPPGLAGIMPVIEIPGMEDARSWEAAERALRYWEAAP